MKKREKNRIIKEVFSDYNTTEFLENLFISNGAIVSDTDMFGSVAALIKSSRKSSPSSIVICAQRPQRLEKKGYMTKSGVIYTESLEIIQRIPACSITVAATQVAENRDKISGSIYCLLYNKNIDGLVPAIMNIKPFVVIRVFTENYTTLVPGFVSRTSGGNNKLMNIIDEDCIGFHDFLLPDDYRQIPRMCGGIIYGDILVPHNKEAGGFSFYKDSIYKTANKLLDIVMRVHGVDFRDKVI